MSASERGDGPGYETEDVDVRNTWAIVGGLALTVALVVAGLAYLQQRFAAAQRDGLPPLTQQQRTPLRPPAPNLQADPYRDIETLLRAEAERLNGYAYTDASRSRARIPIERAMTLTVGKPLDP